MSPRKMEPNPWIGEYGESLLVRSAKQFLSWLEMKRYSRWTVEARYYGLSNFLKWTMGLGLQEPKELTIELIEKYQKSLKHGTGSGLRELSPQAIIDKLISVKMMFRYLMKKKVLSHNPASEIEMPKLGSRLPKALLSQEEVEKVMSQPILRTARGIRDRAMLEVMYSTGIRRFELVNLNLKDVDVKQETLWVRKGKGSKDRLLPLGKRAKEWVERYLEEVRPSLQSERDEGKLWLTLLKEPPGTRWMSKMVMKYMVAAGLEEKVGCHIFRHSMATGMLENGADIRFIQAMLGHEDISTTKLYTKVSLKKLREIHAATHPGEQQRKEQGMEEG